MKNFVIALLIGIILGAGGLWYFQAQRESTAQQEADQRAQQAAEKARRSLAEATSDVKAALSAKLEALELRAQDVQDDLARGSRIVRRKARDLGEAVADAAADAAIAAEVKAKLAADPALSAAAISVDSSGGRVTLAGTAPSHEAIGRAILLALETRGVREVASTLQLEQPKQ
jgi:hyperosmotically inducible periplasmic protein